MAIGRVGSFPSRTGIEQVARPALRQTVRLVDLREALRAVVRERGKALELVDRLFINPSITVRRAQAILGVSDPTARNAIATLQAAGVLREVSGRSWGRR